MKFARFRPCVMFLAVESYAAFIFIVYRMCYAVREISERVILVYFLTKLIYQFRINYTETRRHDI